VPYRHVNNWILDAYEWLNGSLVVPLRGFYLAPRLFTNDDFWRVSADTKTFGSPLNLAPTGGLCLPAGKHRRIITYFQIKVERKDKKALFLATEGSEIRSILVHSP